MPNKNLPFFSVWQETEFTQTSTDIDYLNNILAKTTKKTKSIIHASKEQIQDKAHSFT